VVARIGDCTFAFFVEVAREARTVDSSALTPPHAVTGKFVTHQLTLDGRVMPLIDLAAVIEAVAGAPVDPA
jgi:chemotaxis signal transduction protein